MPGGPAFAGAAVGGAAFGVYLHVPFCTRRCDYCAFATWTDRHHLTEAYVDSCRRELAAASAAGDIVPATSVFVGGGTPSLLPGPTMVRLLAGVPRAPDAEVTVECNPETVTADLLAHYRQAGVTRLSYGVQSLDPAVLASLGRDHRPAEVLRAVALAADAGYGDHYSVDLIMGAAGETVAEWCATVAGVLALDPAPTHVSAYGLTVEPGTPLARDAARHPDPDDQADKYLLADEMLSAAGLRWYEISNWARPGAECRHNQLYWAQGDYRGIGCAAHSHRVSEVDGTSRRWWNVRTPERYIGLVDAGSSAEAAGETLGAVERRTEALQLALRTSGGVPLDSLDPSDLPDGLVAVEGDRWVLTREGRLLANEVALRLQVPVAAPGRR